MPGGTMRCISCRAEMRVLQVEQDHSMKAAGYEHQTLECSRCKKTERRLALTGDKASWPEYWRSLIALDAAAGELPFYQYLVGRQAPAAGNSGTDLFPPGRVSGPAEFHDRPLASASNVSAVRLAPT